LNAIVILQQAYVLTYNLYELMRKWTNLRKNSPLNNQGQLDKFKKNKVL